MTLGTPEGLVEYAAATGRSVPPQDAGALLERGATYLRGTYWDRLQGSATSPAELFPRRGVPGLLDTDVPPQAVEAEYEAAIIALQSPGTLGGTVNSSITREYVSGAVGREYRDDTGKQPSRPLVLDHKLAPWMTVESAGSIFMGSFGPRGLR